MQHKIQGELLLAKLHKSTQLLLVQPLAQIVELELLIQLMHMLTTWLVEHEYQVASKKVLVVDKVTTGENKHRTLASTETLS
jgi:hypothetical protein